MYTIGNTITTWFPGGGDDTFAQRLNKFSNLTFCKDLARGGTLDADSSVGSATATREVAYAADAPGTYVDGNGVIQVVTTANARRMQGGHYTTTGFQVARGEMFEPSSTNLLTRTDGATISDVTGGTSWFNWTGSYSTGNIPIFSNVLVPELTSIVDATSQRIQYTAVDGDSGDYLRRGSPTTAVGSFATNDVVTLSYWARSQSNISVNIRPVIRNRNAAGGALEAFFQPAITVGTNWRKFTYTVTFTHADTSRAIVEVGIDSVSNGEIVDIEFYGVQLEKLPYATSFIPTTTAALTRPADNLKYATAGNRTAATESIFVKFMPYTTFANDGIQRYLITTDTKLRILYKGATSDTIRFYPNYTDSDGSTCLGTTTPLLNTSYIYTAVACGETADVNAILYLNGSSQRTNATDYTANAWGDYFYIGYTSAGTFQLHGIIQSVAIYSDVKATADVAAITAVMNTATS